MLMLGVCLQSTEGSVRRRNKMFGRVGDSPLLGAGTWAKDRTCAISATGRGEVFIQNAAASTVSARIEFGSVGLSE